MVCPGYWTARHSSKLDNVEQIFKIAERLVRRLPPPWECAKRGRRPKFSARKHAAICATAQCFDYTYREVEGQALFFMGKTIDHSTVGWALKRLRRNYVKLLIVLLRREIARLVKCELYMVDSTGISTPRLRRRRKALKMLWAHEFLKLHALVGYSRRAGALVVIAARVTRDNVHDCTQLGRLLVGVGANGEPLLGDRGYDSQRNLELALKHGFKPVIKPRSLEYHGVFRRQMLREFKRNRKLYRRRGIVEAFFGGIENRYGARTRCKLPTTKATSIPLIAVAHNLRTLARVRAMKEMKIFIILWIYSTNSKLGSVL